jgi:NitT/TauT family transport system permease protein
MTSATPANQLAAGIGDSAAEASAKSSRAGLHPSSSLVVGLRVGLLLALLAIWQILSGLKIVNPFYISSPLAIASQFVAWVADGTIADNAGVTLTEALVGWVLGSVLGCLAGFALGRSALAQRVLEPYVVVLNAVPRLALAPLFIIWFGLGIESKIALIVTVVFFVLLINTYAGTQSVDADLQLLARALGSSRWQLTRYIEVPSCLPWIFAGLRLALAYGVAGAVVGEFVASERGLGNLIERRGGLLDVTGQFAALVVLLAMVWLVDLVMSAVERRLFRWRPGGSLQSRF